MGSCVIKNKKMNKCSIAKQGPCGFFCIKYWLDGGCDENCTSDDGRPKICKKGEEVGLLCTRENEVNSKN